MKLESLIFRDRFNTLLDKKFSGVAELRYTMVYGKSQFIIDSPVTMEIELDAGKFCQVFKKEFKDSINDDNIVTITSDNTTGCWADYWQKKLQCQNIIQQDNQ